MNLSVLSYDFIISLSFLIVFTATIIGVILYMLELSLTSKINRTSPSSEIEWSVKTCYESVLLNCDSSVIPEIQRFLLKSKSKEKSEPLELWSYMFFFKKSTNTTTNEVVIYYNIICKKNRCTVLTSWRKTTQEFVDSPAVTDYINPIPDLDIKEESI